MHENWLPEKLPERLGLRVSELSLVDLFNLSIIFIVRRLGYESYFDLDTSSSNLGRTSLDVGYFQDVSKNSVESLNVVAEALNVLLRRKELCFRAVVHVRAGDFDLSDVISPEMYNVVSDDSDVYVVCYDTDYIESQFRKSVDFKFTLVSNEPESDFIFIRDSHTIVASNSTFCFWAALCSNSRNIRFLDGKFASLYSLVSGEEK